MPNVQFLFCFLFFARTLLVGFKEVCRGFFTCSPPGVGCPCPQQTSPAWPPTSPAIACSLAVGPPGAGQGRSVPDFQELECPVIAPGCLPPGWPMHPVSHGLGACVVLGVGQGLAPACRRHGQAVAPPVASPRFWAWSGPPSPEVDGGRPSCHFKVALRVAFLGVASQDLEHSDENCSSVSWVGCCDPLCHALGVASALVCRLGSIPPGRMAGNCAALGACGGDALLEAEAAVACLCLGGSFPCTKLLGSPFRCASSSLVAGLAHLVVVFGGLPPPFDLVHGLRWGMYEGVWLGARASRGLVAATGRRLAFA